MWLTGNSVPPATQWGRLVGPSPLTGEGPNDEDMGPKPSESQLGLRSAVIMDTKAWRAGSVTTTVPFAALR